jgi:NADPH:quinone reductase-like Zn-dependent oxidoreductase
MVIYHESTCSALGCPGAPRRRSGVMEVGVEELPPLRTGEALVRVEAAGLNHAETLIRSGNYSVRLPFPYPLGGEGSGVVVATEPGRRFRWGLGFAGQRLSDRARLL